MILQIKFPNEIKVSGLVALWSLRLELPHPQTTVHGGAQIKGLGVLAAGPYQEADLVT